MMQHQHEDPLSSIAAEIGQALRVTSAALMQGATAHAARRERLAHQRARELRQQQKAYEAASNAARLAVGPDESAKRWLKAIAEAGGTSRASDVWNSSAWPALAKDLAQHEALGRDVVEALGVVIPQRSFDDRRDSAAIIHWRVNHFFNGGFGTRNPKGSEKSSPELAREEARQAQVGQWLTVIADAGGEALAMQVQEGPAWTALLRRLEDLESSGHDVTGALRTVIPQRDFDDRRDAAAILHYRVGEHFGNTDGKNAAEKADSKGLGDNWRWTAEDQLIRKNTRKNLGRNGPTPNPQFRPRNMDPHFRPPDIER